MKVLILLHPVAGTNPSQLGPILPAETHHAWELYKSGAIREIYFRGDAQGAVLVVEAADKADAEQMAASLPLVKAGFAQVQAIPLLPFTAWERLTPG